MVLAGQYLERPTLIRRPMEGAEPITLEGLYHRGDRAPAVVVCAPHPRMGGSMDSPVVAELAWALTQSGRATLRFNYQGVGASPGTIWAPQVDLGGQATIQDVGSEIADARAAVVHLRESVAHGRVAIAGYSFGAAVALGLALSDPSLSHVILVSPPTKLFSFDSVVALKRPVLVVAGQHDPWVDRLHLSELLTGQSDATWELMAGADHTYSRGLTELGRAVTDWMDR
jgi:alpha/beta superfamily hydrolase